MQNKYEYLDEEYEEGYSIPERVIRIHREVDLKQTHMPSKRERLTLRSDKYGIPKAEKVEE